MFFGDRDVVLAAMDDAAHGRSSWSSNGQFTHEPLALALPRGDDDFRLLVDRALSGALRVGRVRGRSTSKYFGELDDATRTFFSCGHARRSDVDGIAELHAERSTMITRSIKRLPSARAHRRRRARHPDGGRSRRARAGRRRCRAAPSRSSRRTRPRMARSVITSDSAIHALLIDWSLGDDKNHARAARVDRVRALAQRQDSDLPAWPSAARRRRSRSKSWRWSTSSSGRSRTRPRSSAAACRPRSVAISR